MGEEKITDIDKICEEYLNGVTTIKLGIKYNVTASTISNRIKRSNNKLAIEELRSKAYIDPNIIINNFINNDIKIEGLAKQYCKDIKYIEGILNDSKNKQVYIKLFDINNRQGEDKEYNLKLIDYLIQHNGKDDIVTKIEKLRELHSII